MKLLHDYNYEDLHEALIDLFHDVEEYSFASEQLVKNPTRVSNGLVFLFTDLESEFNQHIGEFDSVFNRINNFAVPPEGVEKVPKLIYSSDDSKPG